MEGVAVAVALLVRLAHGHEVDIFGRFRLRFLTLTFKV